jgi:hypothetical protein
MKYPCPWCGREFETDRGVYAHLKGCKPYVRWRKKHSEIHFMVFMRTGWRQKIFFPGFKIKIPTVRKPRNQPLKNQTKKSASSKSKKKPRKLLCT